MSSLKGQCLLASPHLRDPNFVRSVVYMIRHDESEGFGVILNRPLYQPLNPVLESAFGWSGSHQIPLYLGGPVEGPVLCLHTNPTLGDMECGHGLFLSSHEEHLLELANQYQGTERFFAGYAGWGPQQLERELEDGGWLTTAIGPQEIFLEDIDLWQMLVKRVGNAILSEVLGTDFSAGDPNRN